MAALIYLMLFALVGCLLQVLVIWQGARWLGAAKPTFRRALGAVALLLVLNGVLAGIYAVMGTERIRGSLPNAAVIASVWAVLLMGMVFAVAIVRWCMQLGSIKSGLVYVASIMPSLLLALLVCRPYLVESYMVSDGSMAPTLVGQHLQLACPQCGQAVMVPLSVHVDLMDLMVPAGICEGCQRTWETAELPELQRPAGRHEIPPSDRFLVDKTASPRRWDVIVFRYPRDPGTLYVKRLVGLPGELIEIKDGALWVDGRRLTPPPPLEGLRYYQGLPADGFKLSSHEYFVLGDFSQRSYDSRDWGGVPADHIVGVVSCRYWPPRRWKVFR